jgi:hypothetical protein
MTSRHDQSSRGAPVHRSHRTRRTRRTRRLAALVVVVPLLALPIGSASAAPLTKAGVKAIAAKVVKKAAPSLSVARSRTSDDAARLGGRAPAAFEDQALVFTVAATPTYPDRQAVIPLPAGRYVVGWSAYLPGASGVTYCHISRHGTSGSLIVAEDAFTGEAPSMSAVGFLETTTGDVVRLRCYSEAAWGTDQPIQVVATPVDTVSGGSLVLENILGPLSADAGRPPGGR